MSHILHFPRAVPEDHRGAVRCQIGDLITRAIRRHIQAWLMRRAIASLRSLDDRTLADIGIYRCEIEAVVRREMAQHG